MLIRTCKFCNQTMEFENRYKWTGHLLNCKMNPDHEKILEKISKANTKEINEHILYCLKCKKEFKIYVTDRDYEMGRYKKHCSRSCANGRKLSEETKQKISKGLLKNFPVVEQKYCLICKKKLYKNNKTGYCNLHVTNAPVSEETKQKISKGTKGKTGGYREKSGYYKKYKGGYYKDIWMDSSWEIAFAERMDNIEIKWERSTKVFFTYLTKQNEQRKYYPDFYIPSKNLYIEIKGRWFPEEKTKVRRSLENHRFNLLILDNLSKIKWLQDEDLIQNANTYDLAE